MNMRFVRLFVRFVLFQAGLLAGVNLATLYPNPNYSASGLNIVLCGLVAIGWVLYEERRTNK